MAYNIYITSYSIHTGVGFAKVLLANNELSNLGRKPDAVSSRPQNRKIPYCSFIGSRLELRIPLLCHATNVIIPLKQVVPIPSVQPLCDRESIVCVGIL